MYKAKTQAEWEADCEAREQQRQAKVEAFKPEPLAGPVASAVDVAWGRGMWRVCGVLVALLIGLLLWCNAQERGRQHRQLFDLQRRAAVGAVQAKWRSDNMQITSPSPGANVAATFNVTVSDVPAGQDELVITIGDTSLLHSIGSVANPSAGTVIVACDAGTVTGAITIYAQCYDPGLTTYASNNPVALHVGLDPFAYDWDTTGGGIGYQIGSLPIAPCRATLGGTEYVVFIGNGGFLLYNVSTKAYTVEALAASPFAPDDVDRYNTAALLDAGDGTHVWACSGLGQSGWIFKKFEVIPGTSATLIDTVTPTGFGVAGSNPSNLAQLADGTLRFMTSSGTTAQLHSYTLGAASASVVATYASGTDLPTGYYPAEFSWYGRYDNALHLSGTQLYWSRRCGTTLHPSWREPQHRFAMYEVDENGCTLLADVVPITARDSSGYNHLTQTWGNIDGEMWGEAGKLAAQDAAVRWEVGSDGTEARTLTDGTADRRWYLNGTPLIMAGWGTVNYQSVAFVRQISFGLLAVPSAIADTTAYTPTVVDVAAEIVAEGVGTGEGDVTLQIIPPVEPVAEGTAGGEGSAVLTVSPPVELTAEGEAGGEGGTLTLRAGPSEIEEASGTAGGTGAARLVSDTTPTPGDGPGALADLELTPGVWPGATRKVALPSYFTRATNRRYGGALVARAKPRYKSPLDAVNDLTQHIAFWTWMAEPADDYVSTAAMPNVGTQAWLQPNKAAYDLSSNRADGGIYHVVNDYQVVITGAPTGYNQTYSPSSFRGNEWVSADGLRLLAYGPLGVLYLYPAGGTYDDAVARKDTTSPNWPWVYNAWYDLPSDTISSMVVHQGDATSAWQSSGLVVAPGGANAPGESYAMGEWRNLYPGISVPTVSIPSDGCTFLWDYTVSEGGPGVSPQLYFEGNSTGTGASGRAIYGTLPPNSVAPKFSYATWHIGVQAVVEFDDVEIWEEQQRHRVIFSVDADSVGKLFHNGVQVGADADCSAVVAPATANPTYASVFGTPAPGQELPPYYPPVGYGEVSRAPICTIHEFGFLSGYAATAADVRQNQGLLFPYGFAASLGGQMTDRPV